MKILAPLFVTVLLAACSSPQGEAAKTAEPAVPAPPAASTEAAPTPVPMADMPAAVGTPAAATGKVESVDAAAGKITIAHGPVDALKWPAMTMTFKAGSTDLSSFKQGDQVAFEFTSTGMDGTLTKIAHQ
jgi:Cu(I)/Ag(I) efflux system protein CusF